jgi:hypothetical protein
MSLHLGRGQIPTWAAPARTSASSWASVVAESCGRSSAMLVFDMGRLLLAPDLVIWGRHQAA